MPEANNTMWKTMGAVWLALAVGCVPPPDAEETSEVEQLGRCSIGGDEFECDPDCSGCGHNGLREGSWDLLFGQFNRTTLLSYGVWDDEPIVPAGAQSLCDPAQSYNDHCVMRWGYSQWIKASPHSRVDIMTHVVAAIARTDYRVQDPQGYGYWGSFGLRPEALRQTWGTRTQETITAALLAQLNAVPGVAICLLNEQAPNNCDLEGGEFHESDVFGNNFRYYFAGISGGEHADDPEENLRFGNLRDSGAAVSYRYRNSAGAHQCDFAGEGPARHAIRCRGANGAVWEYPVTVRTPYAPGSWYFPPKKQIPRPIFWPKVPMED